MPDLVIFGNSGFARILNSLLTEQGQHRVVGFAVDGAHRRGETFLDRPLVALEELELHFPPGEVMAMVAVGYSKMNKVRKEKYLLLKSRGYRMASYLSPRLCHPATVEFGEHNLILDDNYLQPFCRLEENVVLWSANVIGHESVVGAHSFVSSMAALSGFSRIGQGCFLGPNSLVSPGVTLGDRVFLGPGAVAYEDLPDEAVLTAPKSVLRKVRSSRLPPF